ncbi:hypothetical protein BAE44_0022936 [Dichanthelium oligosanthes]|uniref:RRM domain-containing protein n=1 Tax=Dichanthelium oligosanthes TaxID=888268 RepID=A0A1E5UT35_9POAL|nr:hypothetical protein BAE44_0022936 [Dichanthelium oligosanthes]
MAPPPGPCSALGIMDMVVRHLFSRLVFSLQFEPQVSMEIIAFWLWYEGMGHVGFLASVQSSDNHHFLSISLAGKTFVEALRARFSQSGHRSVEFQGGCFDKQAAQGILFYLNNVCYKVLQDILEVAKAKEEMIYRGSQQAQQPQNVRGRAPMSTKDLLSKIKASFTTSSRGHEAEGSSSSTRRLPAPSPKTHILKDIENPIEQCLSTNPLATLYETLMNAIEEEEPADAIQQIQQYPEVPRDERTLFVTFSNGYPFTADELYDFFEGRYGDVERISVQEPIELRPPLYAHITFYNQRTIFRILAGLQTSKFVIRRKHLWARKFVPQRKKGHKKF